QWEYVLVPRQDKNIKVGLFMTSTYPLFLSEDNNIVPRTAQDTFLYPTSPNLSTSIQKPKEAVSE
ncbi:hypothetical protein, partial [Paenibacillus taichungensis]|uniref:hypothetical protein n=1 Tax=Paenibacillus taichungensis TaxID=484184 RepID=UPI001C52AD90